MRSTAVVVLLLAILMAVSNPSVLDFKNYFQAQMAEQAQQSVSGTDGLSVAFRSFATYLGTEYAAATVHRKDYLVFSVFTLEDPNGREYRWVGVLKQFILI